jgi:hypothetical protein
MFADAAVSGLSTGFRRDRPSSLRRCPHSFSQRAVAPQSNSALLKQPDKQERSFRALPAATLQA